MNNIPPKIRKRCEADLYYSRCARNDALHDHVCQANPLNRKLIEWEHTLIFGGKQIQEVWAIIPICYHVHRGGALKKDVNVWIALNRATDDELRKYSKAIDLIRERSRLNDIYRPYPSSKSPYMPSQAPLSEKINY